MKTWIHRLFVVSLALTMGMVALPAPPAVVSAQEASPEATPSLLEGLGLPNLEVTVTVEGLILPTEIAAGPVLLIAHNQTDAGTTVDLAQLPEGVMLDEYLVLSDDDSGAIPDWSANLVLAGYVWVEPGATTSIVLNLAPGEWTVIADAESEIAEQSAGLSITGEAPVSLDIAADLDLEMGEYVFTFPETIAAGPQVWHVTNAHAIPHHAVVFPVDRLYSADEVAAGLMAEFSGTPVAEGFSFATSVMGPPVEIPVITTGQEIWMEANLAPGFYAALCFISDPGSDVPHAMQGMIDSFEARD